MNDLIKDTFERLVENVHLEVKRGLYETFAVSRLTAVIGPRGVGKTTLMLQYIKENLYNAGKVFYFSADSVYFKQITLLQFIDDLYKFEGYRFFFIDEIHQYDNWNQEIKNIYDSYPDVQVVFSGSSMLELLKGSHDLSRRVNIYYLPGLSFREYLIFSEKFDSKPINLSDLIEDPRKYKNLSQIEHILGHFAQYLKNGYYPFIFEDKTKYYDRVMQIVNKIIFEDIPNYYDLKTEHLHLFKKLLGYIASIPPGELNTNSISRNMGVAHQTIEHYLHILESVGLIHLVYPYEGGGQYLRKPQKIFLHNTTLLHALQSFVGTDLNKGTLRELFFLQAIRDSRENVFYSKQGDYRVKDYVMEIGGKNKTDRQIKDLSISGILVKDDLLSPGKNTIPLFYFGFLY